MDDDHGCAIHNHPEPLSRDIIVNLYQLTSKSSKSPSVRIESQDHCARNIGHVEKYNRFVYILTIYYCVHFVLRLNDIISFNINILVNFMCELKINKEKPILLSYVPPIINSMTARKKPPVRLTYENYYDGDALVAVNSCVMKRSPPTKQKSLATHGCIWIAYDTLRLP